LNTTAKPRLLSLNTYHYRRGGSDAAFFENDRLFSEHGWDTAVFTMHHPKNEPTVWSQYFAEELEFGFDYSPMQKAVMAGRVIYSLDARRKLTRLLNRFLPDVAHAHCIYHHLSPSILPLLRKRGIPTVMTAHDLKIACPAYKMFNQHGICERCKHGNLLNVAVNRCLHGSLALSTLIMVESSVHRLLGLYRDNLDRVIVPSKFYGEKLAEWGWPRDKLVYIPNYIDAENFEPQYTPGDYFLYFGRLAPEKGVDSLIRAAVSLGVRLKIAGTGPSGDGLKALAGQATGVEFLGHCAGEQLWRLVREARAIVLPSRWYENAPLSVLEGYASGKPVIGARIGGIAEMVREGETGFLFESGNVEDLSRAVQHVSTLRDEQLAEMGRAARQYVRDSFTRDQYFERTLDLYRSLGVRLRTPKKPPPTFPSGGSA
jgi:glycosyltransferase involved in cell wall biosynthesis